MHGDDRFFFSGIESVFSKIGCDVTSITDMLGGHAGVTDNTVLQYLGIVEQRTNELLQLQAFIQAKVWLNYSHRNRPFNNY